MADQNFKKLKNVPVCDHEKLEMSHVCNIGSTICSVIALLVSNASWELLLLLSQYEGKIIQISLDYTL